MSSNDFNHCDCSCHHEDSHHMSACCYTCLRCDTDRITPMAFGHGNVCRQCEVFAMLTDDELQQVVNGIFKFDPRKHWLPDTSSLALGMSAEIEFWRRQREQKQVLDELYTPCMHCGIIKSVHHVCTDCVCCTCPQKSGGGDECPQGYTSLGYKKAKE